MPLAARQFDPAIPAHPGIVGGTTFASPPCSALGCSPDVNVGFLPAARMSDPFTCALPPTAGPHFENTITTGSASVFINHHPAARVGDALACGSTIFAGCPTINIGGPTFGNVTVIIGGITIQGSPAFIRRTIAELARLLLLPDGRTLLLGMRNTTIVEYTGPNSYMVPLDMTGAYNGTGSGVVIGFNPNLTLQVFALGTPTGTAPTPSHIVLGHELVHGSHANTGALQPNDEPSTIGFPFIGGGPSENTLRRQTGPGLGQRVGHGSASPPDRVIGAPPGPVR